MKVVWKLVVGRSVIMVFFEDGFRFVDLNKDFPYVVTEMLAVLVEMALRFCVQE